MAVFVQHLSPMSVSWVSIVLKFIAIMFSVSISGMPNKVCPFLRTTKNMQYFHLLSCYNLSLPIPKSVIVVLVYVFNCMATIFGWCHLFFCCLRKQFLYMCKGITFPSLLCLVYMVLLLKLDLMMFLDFLLLLNIFIEMNRIYIHFINMIYFFMVLVWFLFQIMNSSISSTSADFSEVVDLSALCTLLSHGLGIFWADGLNHNICSSGLWAFGMLLFLFSYCLCPSFTVFICKSLLIHLGWWLSWIGLFGLPLGLAHLLHLDFPWFWWVL